MHGVLGASAWKGRISLPLLTAHWLEVDIWPPPAARGWERRGEQETVNVSLHLPSMVSHCPRDRVLTLTSLAFPYSLPHTPCPRDAEVFGPQGGLPSCSPPPLCTYCHSVPTPLLLADSFSSFMAHITFYLVFPRWDGVPSVGSCNSLRIDHWASLPSHLFSCLLDSLPALVCDL